MIKIRAFIDGWNEPQHPFIWTKTADEVLEKIKRETNSLTRRWVGWGVPSLPKLSSRR